MSDIGRLFQLKLYSYKVTIQSRHKTKGKKKKKNTAWEMNGQHAFLCHFFLSLEQLFGDVDL